MRFVKILFSLLFVGTVIFTLYIKFSDKTDYSAPVINCEVELITASVKDSEEKLLSYVTAKDEKDGNLTADVIIESISPFVANNKAIITYAVCDSDNNVSKLEAEVVYKDYKPPVFSFETQHIYFVGASRVDLLAGVSAFDSIDGDITSSIVVIESQIDISQPGVYPVKYRVTTSKGVTSEMEINAYVYSSRLKDKIELSDYLVYADINNKIEPMDFVVEYPNVYFEDYRNDGYDYDFDITNNINYSKPGIYYVTYRVSRAERYNNNSETEILAEAYLAVAVRGEN